jgi:thiol-disulfide isomerase/thioredoxin
LRSIVFLLPLAALPTLLIAGCDKRSTPTEQANATLDNTVSPINGAAPAADDANTVSPDEAAPTESTAPAVRTADRSHAGEAAPATAFKGPDGAPLTIAKFKGKPVLVNLWATWCAPCVAEMPTLDKLAAQGKVQVVTVSQDMDGATKVGPYFAKAGFKTLKQYLDPDLKMSKAFGNPSLPTSILYDSAGKEVWRMNGGMDWTGPEAQKLLAEAK